MDTHSPAITESLIAAEVFFGTSPTEILLIGISAETYPAGCTLSDQVQSAVGPWCRLCLRNSTAWRDIQEERKCGLSGLVVGGATRLTPGRTIAAL